MLKAIVFDFDGIIANSEPLHCRAFQRLAEAELDFRFDFDHYLTHYIGSDDWDALKDMLRHAGKAQLASDATYVSRLVELKAQAFEQAVLEGLTAYPGVAAFIAEAAGQLPIAIASGATRRDIDLMLRELDLAHWFEVIVSTDSVPVSKPDPATYRLAVEELAKRHPAQRITPQDCVAIEDTATGVESARGAGLWTLGVTSTSSADKLHRAHRVIKGFEGLSVAQLRKWFD